MGQHGEKELLVIIETGLNILMVKLVKGHVTSLRPATGQMVQVDVVRSFSSFTSALKTVWKLKTATPNVQTSNLSSGRTAGMCHSPGFCARVCLTAPETHANQKEDLNFFLFFF